MPSKRKRDILDGFDPNKSDPEDENFEPGEEREPRSRRSNKRSHASKGKTPSRRRDRYGGSDIDEDDDVISDSELEGGYSEGNDDEDDDEDDRPITATGRRMRKAAVTHQSYKESSDEEGETEPNPEESEPERKPSKKKQPPVRSRIITIKNPKALHARSGHSKEPPTPSVSTRRTRARTEEAEEFVELSNSGRHARPTRTASKSKSPEAATRSSRATRGGKGVKKPRPAIIEEATQESSGQGAAQDEGVDLGGDGAADDRSVKDSDVEVADLPADEVEEADVDEADEADDVEQEGQGGQDNGGEGEDEDDNNKADEVGEADDKAEGDEAEDEEDEDDIAPAPRRTRASRASISAPAAEEAEDESENVAPSRRLTRGRTGKKSLQEPSSDFEPGDESGEGEGSAWGASSRKGGRGRPKADDDGDEEYSSGNARGRRQTQGQSKRASARQRNSKGKESGDEEVDLDQDELAEELEELRQSSRSRRRRRSPSIVYEQPLPKRRRVTRVVDYSIKPLDQLVDQEEEEDQAPTPARGRRGGRNGASTAWQRPLASTFGPFGGGGGMGSLFGGPWGTGATGGVETDSSDDEAAPRPANVGGNIGMTPTSAAMPTFGQPLNLEGMAGVAATPNLGKVKNQKAFADADPLGVDLTVDFSKVGGLQGHIDQLKEMITLPLLYPELFLKYKVTPPRGVLFHGPPGTGKTLLARALSNAVGIGGQKITFYMRKGADALSKWVGEAEKQLRLLFEEARRTQPSIIFFDEIDGLAPVRSSKQEQIHASIVSTLLALMDGMDGRGQVIVIGATNRPDSVDPALRRPGRFDREFYFPLPDVEGRKAIIDIHTQDWGLSEEFRLKLADNTKGYGGADLRALCTEAALNSIQRTYPQIYSSREKLVVDPDRITVHATDFMISMKKMVPSSQRSASSAAAALPPSVEPLLRQPLATMVRALDQILPRKKKTTALEEAMWEPFEDEDNGFGRESLNQEFERLRIFRPRLLIFGAPGMGQEYLSAAVLHYLEGVHVQNFDLATLVGDGAPLEQVIVRLFVEVKRHKPAVIFIPNLESWHETVSGAAYKAFVTMLRSIPATDPVLLLGTTAEEDSSALPPEALKDLFGFSRRNRKEILRPGPENRKEYFLNIISHVRMAPTDFPDPTNRKRRVLEQLLVAPPPPPRQRTKEEIEKELHSDHIALNLLKVQLQPIMDQIKQKYRKFRNSVISIQQIEYLWQEADPNFVRADLTGTGAGEEGSLSAAAGAHHPHLEQQHQQHQQQQQQQRPFEMAKDKEGVEGLRETATGKFFYNLDVATIEERLSNGFYARPIDFFKDIESLAKDARNIGDRERTLKANELVSNVRVDVHEVGVRLQNIGFDALYERQKQRAKQAEEKRKRREAMSRVINLVRPDALQRQDPQLSEDGGPITIGAPLPGSTTSARFRVMSPDPHLGGGSGSGLSNGNSVPSRAGGDGGVVGGGDVVMGGTDDDNGNSNNHTATSSSQRLSQMGPPPPLQWPVGSGGASGAGGRVVATTAATQVSVTHISQRSVITTVPAGVSPSAMLNDASTTTSNSQNRSSDRWSTQATNGLSSSPTNSNNHHHQQHNQPESGGSGGQHSQMPDTQSLGGLGPSQSTSNESQWAHSQAQGLARGEFEGHPAAAAAVAATSASLHHNTVLGVGGVPGLAGSPTSSQLHHQHQHHHSGSGSLSAASSARKSSSISIMANTTASSAVSARRNMSVAMSSLLNSSDEPSLTGQAAGPRDSLGGAGGPGASSSATSSQQHVVLHEDQVQRFLHNLVDRTRGCTIDQLEQINRELMAEVWATRGEWNRNKVLSSLTTVYNDTMADIEQTQGSFPNTQEQQQSAAAAEDLVPPMGGSSRPLVRRRDDDYVRI